MRLRGFATLACAALSSRLARAVVQQRHDGRPAPLVRHEKGAAASLEQEREGRRANAALHVNLGPNLVKNGDFQDGMMFWAEFNMVNRYEGTKLHNCSGTMLAHLHTLCRHSAGGIQQEVPTEPGQDYLVFFKAYSGPWGNESVKDIVRVSAGGPNGLNRDLEVGKNHSIFRQDGEGAEGLKLSCVLPPLAAEYEFKADSNVTHLRFWAPQGACIDITEVMVKSKFEPNYESEDANSEAEDEAEAKDIISSISSIR